MEKYIVIADISKYRSYKNINARLLYLHVACHMDVRTYTYAHSWRQLAAELNMTYSQFRVALKNLLDDGLITTQVATQVAAQYVTQKTTQQTTHIHLVTIKDLKKVNDSPNGSPNDSPNDSPHDSLNGSDNNIINKKNKKKGKNRPSSAKEKDILSLFLENMTGIPVEIREG